MSSSAVDVGAIVAAMVPGAAVTVGAADVGAADGAAVTVGAADGERVATFCSSSHALLSQRTHVP